MVEWESVGLTNQRLLDQIPMEVTFLQQECFWYDLGNPLVSILPTSSDYKIHLKSVESVYGSTFRMVELGHPVNILVRLLHKMS